MSSGKKYVYVAQLEVRTVYIGGKTAYKVHVISEIILGIYTTRRIGDMIELYKILSDKYNLDVSNNFVQLSDHHANT